MALFRVAPGAIYDLSTYRMHFLHGRAEEMEFDKAKWFS